MKKQFLVIGLGRFGTSVVQALSEADAQVLALDIREDKINAIAPYATHAIALDATDEATLKNVGLRDFDVAVIAVGDMQASILITLLVKEMGVPYVLVKAKNDLHAKVLMRTGADKVVFPERDTGIRVANNLLSSNILDFIELSDSYGLAEINVLPDWAGKTLYEVDARRRFGVNIIAIRHSDDDIDACPSADAVLCGEDVVIVIGHDKALNRLQELS